MLERILALMITCVIIATASSQSGFTPGLTPPGKPHTDSSLASNFSQSCTSWGGFYGSDYAILQATCPGGSDGPSTTSINLNDCITFTGATLLCQQNGYFLAACTLTSGPSNGSTLLEATCPVDNGAIYTYDIDQCVGNNWGTLQC